MPHDGLLVFPVIADSGWGLDTATLHINGLLAFRVTSGGTASGADYTQEVKKGSVVIYRGRYNERTDVLLYPKINN